MDVNTAIAHLTVNIVCKLYVLLCMHDVRIVVEKTCELLDPYACILRIAATTICARLLLGVIRTCLPSKYDRDQREKEKEMMDFTTKTVFWYQCYV